MHFLTSGCSAPSRRITEILSSVSATRKTSRKQKECMINMSGKWSVEFFNIKRKGTNSQHGLQRISSMIAQKHVKTYSKTFNCISCKLSYSLLHSAIMCLRGARSSIHHPTTSPHTMDLASHEGRVPLHWTEPTYIQIKWRYICISTWLIEFTPGKKKKKKKNKETPWW